MNLMHTREWISFEEMNLLLCDKKDKEIINNSSCKNAILEANDLMGSKGRILVRKSGTEPKIRIMAESDDKSLIYKCIRIIKRSIN